MYLNLVSVKKLRNVACMCLGLWISVPFACVGAPAAGQSWDDYESRGVEASKNGFYEEAIKNFDIAKKLAEDAGDQNHLAATINDMGTVYQHTGRKAEAIDGLKKSLAIREKMYGAENSGIASNLDNIAWFYINDHKYAEAKPYADRALSIALKTMGDNDIKTAGAYSTCAAIAEGEKNYPEAEKQYKTSMGIMENLLGEEDRLCAKNRLGIAKIYREEGKLKEAKDVLEKALVLNEKAVGGSQSVISQNLYDLANVLADLGENEQSEKLFEKALVMRDTCGVSVEDVVLTLKDYAKLLTREGKTKEAEVFQKRAQVMDAEAAGDQLKVAIWREHNELGVKALIGGDVNASERYLTLAAKDAEAFPNPGPRVITSLNNLAGLYNKQGKYTETEATYYRVLALEQKVYGPDHLLVARTINNIIALRGMICAQQKNYQSLAELEPLCKIALQIQQKQLPANDLMLSATMNNLAAIYLIQQKKDQATSLLNKAIEIAQHADKTSDPVNLGIMQGYVPVLQQMGRNTEATELQSKIQSWK